MTEARINRTRRSLTTPRAAAVAGIVFALLFGTSIVLIRMSVPADGTLAGGRLTNNPGAVGLALNLLFSIVRIAWTILIFPIWVLAISIYYLVVSARREAPVPTSHP